MNNNLEYIQARRHCLDLAEPFRGMHPSIIADTGGFRGLIENLKQSLPERPLVAQMAVRDFVHDLELIMHASIPFLTNDADPEDYRSMTDEEARLSHYMHSVEGKKWREISEAIGLPALAIRRGINEWKARQA